MKTTKFELNIGVNAGYSHDNAQGGDVVAAKWQEVAEEVFGETGVSVAGVVTPATTVYRKEWGCPEGGELTAVVSGLRNPEFLTDDLNWRAAVTLVATRVGKAFGQQTAYLTFSEVEFDYLKPLAV